MNIVALIPARGGSKGLPLKNIRVLNKKPLIMRTIEEALKVQLIKDVFVSTDSSLIEDVSLQANAKIIKRPADISDDHATTNSVILHAISFFQKENIDVDIIVLLQCTAPFLKKEDIEGCIQTLIDESSDSCIAVTKFHHFIWEKDIENGAYCINHDKFIRKRRQDLKVQYLETGSVYVIKVNTFLKEQSTFCGKTSLFEIDNANRALEIDTPFDFYLAENIEKYLSLSDEEIEKYKNNIKD